MWFYVANHGKTLGFIMKFSTKHSRKIFMYYFIQFLQFLLFFQVYFGEKI